MTTPSKVRILQWNVCHRSSPEEIVAHLREAAADILCLQELTADSSYHPGVHVPNLVSKELTMEGFYHVDRELRDDRFGGRDDFVHDGTGIFSKFPISRSRAVTLSTGGLNKFKSGHGQRRYLEVDIAIPGRETPLTVATTHMSFLAAIATDLSIRHREVEKLVAATRERSRDFILTGDINGDPDSHPVRSIAAELRMVSNPSIATYRRIIHRTLDYMFTTRDVSVRSVQVLDQGPSDHCPLVMEVSV